MPDAFHDKHLLIRAARGERVERPPVWAMRQAGRWDPEFRKVRAGMSFFEFSENVEAAARASLCPRRFGVDAIILFYDITTLPLAMGLPFELKPGAGPVPDRPIRTLADLDRLNPEPSPDSYGHIRALLKRVKDELQGDLPVLVFAGAPFTVATYCIGTGKDVDATRAFAAEAPAVWNGLLERLSGATVGVPPHAHRRRRRRLPTLRLVGRRCSHQKSTTGGRSRFTKAFWRARRVCRASSS